jgi:hypothetical protein
MPGNFLCPAIFYARQFFMPGSRTPDTYNKTAIKITDGRCY